MPNSLALLNKQTSKPAIGSFWHELETRARTERGDRPNLKHQWIRDYCEIISDNSIPQIFIQGCSQVGKSYFNFLNANYQASKGYRVLVILPTREALLRNLKNQIVPISNTWGLIETTGTQLWQARGGGAIIYGYASTSGSAPSKGAYGLANTGGSGSAVSADILIIDEASQIAPDSLAPFERRLDAGKLEARPTRYLGTAGGGGGIERFTANAPQVYPQCACPNCHQSFDLDPYKCVFTTVTPSGWIAEWSRDEAGEACVRCPHCSSIVTNPLETTRIHKANSDAMAVFLTPLLRSGNPAKELIRSMLSAQRNAGGGAQDWLQQALGVPSSLRGFMSLEPKDLEPKAIPVKPNSLQGIFCGFDQGIGSHYGAKIAVFIGLEGLPVIKVIAIEAGGEPMIQKLSHGCNSGLIDTMPDRTLALQLCDNSRVLTLARQKYNLGYLNTEGRVSIGDGEHECIELPITPHLTLLEAALDGRLSFDCELDAMAKRHLLAPKFDRSGYKLIRPANHEDDLYFALYFAVGAYLASIA